MSPSLFRLAALLLAAALFLVNPARAWDDGGHLLIARIAYDRLSPAKQAKLVAALDGLTFGPNSYADSIRAAIYMDKLRDGTRSFRPPYPGAFGTWHFIQIPFESDGVLLRRGEPDVDGVADVTRGWRWCRSVVLGGVPVRENYLGRTFTIGPREALAMLMHLTGDAHQPLHATSHEATGLADDRGGNSLEVLNLRPRGNLHHFWDSAYRQMPVAQPDGTTLVREDKARIVARDSTLASQPLAELARAFTAEAHTTAAARRVRTPESWVKESHQIGVAVGYEALGSQLGKAEVTLSARYVTDASAAARARIVLAGERLAVLLDSLL